jgi:hypothetical protein
VEGAPSPRAAPRARARAPPAPVSELAAVARMLREAAAAQGAWLAARAGEGAPRMHVPALVILAHMLHLG